MEVLRDLPSLPEVTLEILAILQVVKKNETEYWILPAWANPNYEDRTGPRRWAVCIETLETGNSCCLSKYEVGGGRELELIESKCFSERTGGNGASWRAAMRTGISWMLDSIVDVTKDYLQFVTKTLG